MQKRHIGKKRSVFEVDMSAFSDLAFLLIIFFILTTTLEQFTGYELDIPSGVEKEDQEDTEQLTLVVSAEEIYYGVDAIRITLDELPARLREERFAELPANERVVLVEARDDVPFDLYYKVISAISRSGGVLGLARQAEGGAQ